MNTRDLFGALTVSACIVAATTPAQAQTVSFRIPAGSLDAAIDAYARQTGRQIIYRADDIRGVQTKGVQGEMSADAALAILLKDTGFTCRKDPSGAVAIVAVQARAGHSSAESEFAEIVVTGSRIPGAASTSPLTEISRSQILESGRARLGDVLRQIPQNFAGGQNPTNVGGNNGSLNGTASSSSASIANLRGLGSDSTLTLINGHRAAFDTISYGVDLSLIPVAAVQRIDVLTDGASALYGSDAVAGVVNVILRDDFSGGETQARFGTATRGGYGNVRLSQIVGGNWSGGNLTAAAEYFYADPLTSKDRRFARQAETPTDLSPRQSDLSFFINGHQDVSDTLTAYVTGLYAERISDVRLTSSSSRDSHDELEEYSLVAGLRGRLAGRWTIDLSGSHGRSLNHLLATSRASATAAPVRSVSITRNGVDSVDVAAEGPLLALPSGTVHVALGGGYRSEGFEIDNTSTPQDSDRAVSYGYVETKIPLIADDTDRSFVQRAFLSAAARYERYSDFGGATSPKIGMFVELLRDLDVRASWGRSFRAPTLSELYSGAFTSLYRGSLFGLSAPPNATVMIATGSNPDLEAQKAATWTVGLAYHPDWARGAHLKIGYFHISYKDRIALPITNLTQALKDSVYAPFVIPNPPTDLQQSFVDRSVFPIFNNAGAPYDPANVVALLLDSYTNVTSQLAKGWDVSLDYGHDTAVGRFTASVAGTWLSLKQRLLPTSPALTIDGTLFNVPSFKGVGTLGWSKGPASIAVTVNHISGEVDLATPAKVDALTTVDLVVDLKSRASSGFLHGFDIQVAATNLLDADPPFVDPARNTYSKLAYDPSNASPFGRIVSLTLTKRW